MSDHFRKGVLAGVAAFGLLVSSAALAQSKPRAKLEPPPADAVVSGVTVAVPKVIETTKYGLITSEYSMSVRVPYGDLNMQTPEGVAELNRRVDAAADYACDQLENMYPEGGPAVRICVRRAVSDAQPQVIKARAPG